MSLIASGKAKAVSFDAALLFVLGNVPAMATPTAACTVAAFGAVAAGSGGAAMLIRLLQLCLLLLQCPLLLSHVAFHSSNCRCCSCCG